MSLLVRGDLNLLMSETERQRIALAAGSGEGTAAMLSRAMHLVHPGNAYRVAHEKSVLKHEGASVAAASRAIAEGLTGLASPAAVLPMAVPGVHMLGEATPALQAKVRQGLGIPSDAPLILFPSTRPRIDGFGPLMLALRMMRERGSGAIVLLAGSYRYTHLSWIAELGLREAVRFAGPTRRLGLLYAACDVVVHPTRGDGAGQAVLLAIAAGKPVVTTGGGVAAGLLEQAGARGAVQLLQADVSPDGIAEALDQALAAPDRVEWESTCRGLVEQWSPAGQARVVLNHLAGINSASALALDGD